MSKRIYETHGFVASTLCGGADVGKVLQITLPYGAHFQLNKREALELAVAIAKGFGLQPIIWEEL